MDWNLLPESSIMWMHSPSHSIRHAWQSMQALPATPTDMPPLVPSLVVGVVLVAVLDVGPLCVDVLVRLPVPLHLGGRVVCVRGDHVLPAAHLEDRDWAHVLAVLAACAFRLVNVDVHSASRITIDPTANMHIGAFGT
jgi:hypothetical protein